MAYISFQGKKEEPFDTHTHHTTLHHTTPHHTTPHHTHKHDLDFLADYYGVHLPQFMLEFDSH